MRDKSSGESWFASSRVQSIEVRALSRRCPRRISSDRSDLCLNRGCGQGKGGRTVMPASMGRSRTEVVAAHALFRRGGSASLSRSLKQGGVVDGFAQVVREQRVPHIALPSTSTYAGRRAARSLLYGRLVGESRSFVGDVPMTQRDRRRSL